METTDEKELPSQVWKIMLTLRIAILWKPLALVWFSQIVDSTALLKPFGITSIFKA